MGRRGLIRADQDTVVVIERNRQGVRLGIVALVLLALGWWFVHRNGDRQRILRQLQELEDTLEKDGPESQLVSLAEGRRVLELLTPSFLLSALPYEGSLTQPNELLAAFHRYRSLGETIQVILAEQELEVHSNGTAWLLFRATVTADLGDRKGREGYVVSSDWVNEGGEWLIREMEILEVLGSDDGFGLFR